MNRSALLSGSGGTFPQNALEREPCRELRRAWQDHWEQISESDPKFPAPERGLEGVNIDPTLDTTPFPWLCLIETLFGEKLRLPIVVSGSR